MNLRPQRRMAAELLKCGINRVWIDPDRVDDVEEAATKDDIRYLIKIGAIKARKIKGTSRHRARMREIKKAKGRRRGHGSRKGRKYARYPRKWQWMRTIRAIRRQLREWRDSGVIDRRTYRMLYMKAKGGMFKSRAHLIVQVKTMGLLKEDVEDGKRTNV